MTRAECKQAVLDNLGETLKVTAGPAIDAPWASETLDGLMDVFYPDPNYGFSELDVAGLLMKMRIKWYGGNA